MSSASNSRVILFRYDGSPYVGKIEYVLLLKNIPYSTVEVSPILPRPETSNLGVGYRRIPILAIDNDVYCDSGLIVSVLEKRFPESSGYGTIYPTHSDSGNTKADTNVLGAFSSYYIERDIMQLGATAKVDWTKISAEFIKDRSQLLGAPIDPVARAAQVPAAKASLMAHLAMINGQLSNGRGWLFDTNSPSLADVSVYSILNWLRQGENVHDLFDKSRFPYIIEWLDHMTQHLQEKRAAGWSPRTELSKEEAVSIIASSSFQPYDIVGFDQDQADRLGIELGCTVSVVPTDSGRDNPTTGKLVALALNEVVIQVQGSEAPTGVRCHFPLLLYSVKKVE